RSLTTAAIPLPTSGQSGNNRAQQSNRRFRLDDALRPLRMAPLGLCPYLLSHRLPLAHRRRARLAVGLCHLPPRRADHSRRNRRRDDAAAANAAAALTHGMGEEETI